MPCPGKTADSADGRRSEHTQSKNRKERKARKEMDVERVKRSRLLTAERQAIGSPVAGEKSVYSERERSSQPAFSPADLPGARRFCLLFVLFEWVALCLSVSLWFNRCCRSTGRQPSINNSRPLIVTTK